MAASPQPTSTYSLEDFFSTPASPVVAHDPFGDTFSSAWSDNSIFGQRPISPPHAAYEELFSSSPASSTDANILYDLDNSLLFDLQRSSCNSHQLSFASTSSTTSDSLSADDIDFDAVGDFLNFNNFDASAVAAAAAADASQPLIDLDSALCQAHITGLLNTPLLPSLPRISQAHSLKSKSSSPKRRISTKPSALSFDSSSDDAASTTSSGTRRERSLTHTVRERLTRYPAEIFELSCKDLNAWMKARNYSEQQVLDIKRARRQEQNRKSARTFRSNRV